LVQELIDYRLASYQVRQTAATGTATDTNASSGAMPVANPPNPTSNVGNIIAFPIKRTQLPYFPDLKIACGHFRSASTEAIEHRSLCDDFGRLDPARHFIARASGNSMNGGKNPVCDGDYLLLELVSPSKAGAITGSVMAIEQQDASGDNQYLLRSVLKSADGSYILRASNPAYPDMSATDAMRTLARLRAVINPLELTADENPVLQE
jgi:SOS-response transcriptional repressor LexA